MTTQQMTVPATLPMTVRLEAQHWNVVIAALRKLPFEMVEFVLPMVNEQLQAQAQSGAPASANGLDRVDMSAAA